MTWSARHISQSIDVDPIVVARHAGDPANLPKWAAGLASGIRQVDGRWISESPMGTVEVEFVGPVEAGVLDHDVTLPDGAVVHNPLRVLRNDAGSEVVFTLYRRDGIGDDEWARDAELVAADLKRLKALLEAV